MRLDHIAYRVADRRQTSQFFIDAFDYKIQTEFEIEFDDGSKAECIALEPPEKLEPSPWAYSVPGIVTFHLPPEIFISDGTPESIVGQWVAARNGVGGIHHLAYQVDSVEKTMKEWLEKGYAEFTSEDVLKCEGLVQVFTKPSQLTGVIYEFIKRDEFGFCKDSVKGLMESTKGL